jgi:hypothetical protein
MDITTQRKVCERAIALGGVADNFNSHAWRKVKLHGAAVAECKACGARLGSQRSRELCKGHS